MGVTTTQNSPGSFHWDYLTITDGTDVNDVGWFGDAYVIQSGSPSGQIGYSSHWWCSRVAYESYGSVGINVTDSTTQGYWDQYSTSGIDCYNPTPFQDYIAVQAY